MTKTEIIDLLRASQLAAIDYIRRRQGVLVGHNHVVRTGGGMYYLPDGCHMAGAQRDARGRALGVTPYAHEAAHYEPAAAQRLAAVLRDGTDAPSTAVPALQAARDDVERLAGLIERLAGGETGKAIALDTVGDTLAAEVKGGA